MPRALLFLALVGASMMQAQIAGDLAVRVTDPSGERVPGAAVTARQRETGAVRLLRTGDQGEAWIRQLAPGPYEIRIEAPGFALFVTEAAVSSGAVSAVGAGLTIGMADQTVTVGNAVEPLDAASGQLDVVTAGTRVVSLPVGTVRGPLALGGGAVLSVAFNAPGVIPNLPRSATSNPGTFSVNGNRGRSNNITLDNATVTDVVAAGAMGLQTLPLDAIREFHILSANYGAEFGRNSGAQIQIVSRGGSNGFHGSLFDYFRNAALNTRDFFDRTGRATPLNSHDWGATAGGPAIRNRVFVFGHYQQIKTRGYGNTRIASVPRPEQVARASDATARRLLEQLQVPVSASGSVANASPQTADFRGASVRLDANLSRRDFAFLRVGYADYLFRSAVTTFVNSDLPTSGTGVANTPVNATLSHTHILGASAVNQFVTSFGRSVPAFPPLFNLGGPFIRFAGGTSAFGWDAGVTNLRLQNTFQYLDTLAWKMGHHYMKAGADVGRTQSNTFSDLELRGSFLFLNLEDFLAGRPSEYTQRFGNSYRGLRQWTAALFLQDDYRMSPSVSVNLGVRAERTGGISEVNGLLANLDFSRREPVGGAGAGPLGAFDAGGHAFQPRWNVGPRLGFAWNPGRTRTAVRGGYGIGYDFIPFSVVTNLRTFPPLMYRFTLPGAAITGENSFANLVAGTSAFQRRGREAVGTFPSNVTNFGAITAVDQALRNPLVQQWNLTVDRELWKGVTARGSYVGSRGTRLLRQRPINTVAGGMFAPPANLVEEQLLVGSGIARRVDDGLRAGPESRSNRVDPRFGAVNLIESSAASVYHSAQMSVMGRAREGLQFSGAYTWSKSIDDVSDPFATSLNDSQFAQHPFDHRNNRAVSAFHVGHRVVLTHSFEPQWERRMGSRVGRAVVGRWQFHGIYQAQSGLPVTLLAGPRLGFADPTLLGGNGVVRPDRIGEVRLAFTPDPGGGRNVDKAAASGLVAPLLGRLGTLGRNTMRLHPLVQADWTFVKEVPVGERAALSLQVQVYNVLNRATFALGAGGRGRTLSAPANFGYYSDTDSDARNVQIVARLRW